MAQICHFLRVSMSPRRKIHFLCMDLTERGFRVKNNDLYFLLDLRISRAERFKVIFPFSPLKSTFETTELIHVIDVVRTISLL